MNSEEKTKFVINSFNKLSLEEQSEIVDFVSGLTPNWRIIEVENDKEN